MLFYRLCQLMNRHCVFVAVVVALDYFEIGKNPPIFIAIVCAQIYGFGAIGFTRPLRNRAVESPAASGKVMSDATDGIMLMPEIAAAIVIEIDG